MAQDAQSPPPGAPPGAPPPGGELPPGPQLPPGGYVPVPLQPPVPQGPPTSGMAIAGFVCALCGLITCGIASVVGLVLSIVAMNQIKAAEGRIGGKGLAIAGLAVSIAIVALAALYVLFWIVLAGTLATAGAGNW